MAGPLDGVVVGVTADRRWEEQADLLSRRGATVRHAPTIATVLMGADPALRAVTAAILAEPPDYLVATTGLGMRTWMDAAEDWGLRPQLVEALGRSRVVARGPKSASALTQAGVEVWQRSPTEQMDAIVDILVGEDLADRRVALQEYGTRHARFADHVTAAGATIIDVPVYRWRLPDDTGPARAVIADAIEGRVHAVTFTSAPAVHNLFEIALEDDSAADLVDAFNADLVAACVGPVCAAGAREEGITNPLAPDVGRLGLLVRALSDRFHTPV